jgi:glycosyltransferase involved in cell wall biosynthesis
MVTANRKRLARRSIECFRRQTYPETELVIVDDGDEDYSSLLEGIPRTRYVRIEKAEGNVLGHLRNISLEAAQGEIITQWDDDDWYHPDRLQRQASVLAQGYDACCLTGALMHLDTPAFFDHPYLGYLAAGVPGSIMHVRDEAIRYPETRRAEDSVYLDHWIKSRRYLLMPRSESHLFIRCFHGSNTWEVEHFLTRMRNTPGDALAFLWYRFIVRDLFRHTRFKLPTEVRESFEMYLDDSRRAGIFS